MSIKKPTYKIGHPDISEKPKTIIKPPKIYMTESAINHCTQVVVIPKMETAQEDRILKKLIKEDYKHVFRDVVVVRADQIDKKDFSNNFRGKNVSGVELRTYISEEKYSILRSATAPVMSFSKDSYLKHNVYEKVKTNETDKNH